MSLRPPLQITTESFRRAPGRTPHSLGLKVGDRTSVSDRARHRSSYARITSSEIVFPATSSARTRSETEPLPCNDAV